MKHINLSHQIINIGCGVMRFTLITATFIFTLLILSISVFATYGPRAYLYETVRADFDPDGTYSSDTFSPCNENPCAAGYIKASVPNSDDVLQYLRINVSSTTNTDLNSMEFFRDTLTSFPTADSKQTVNCNATHDGDDDADTWYNVTNWTVAPAIELNFSVLNYAGGNDTVDDDDLLTTINNLNFTIYVTNPSDTYNISNVDFIIQFDLDTGPGYDAVNVSTTPTVTGGYGTASKTDSDTDGDFDQVNWTDGYIPPSTTITIQFNATINDLNWGTGETSEDLDDDTSSNEGVDADHLNSTSTLSMISIVYKFTRGPIRQGIDIIKDGGGYWRIRGLIENIANSSVSAGEDMLTYNITEWRLYEIDTATGQPYDNPNVTGVFNGSTTASQILPTDGRIYTTDSARSNDTEWFNSTSQTKVYFTSYFNWSILWNTTDSENYWSYINSTLDMPTLYRIDITNTEADSGLINPDTGGDVVTINHTTMHAGDTAIRTDQIEIYAVIPANTTGGNDHGQFAVHSTSIEVWWYDSDGTTWWELNKADAELTVTVSNATSSADGYINVSISDLSAVDREAAGDVGEDLGLNDKIRLRFQVVSNESMTTGDSYNFTGNATHYTVSGTPISEPLAYKVIQVSAVRLTGYKDLIIEDPNCPTMINVSINLTVEGETIAGIKFTDYVPEQALYGFNMSANASVYYYNATEETLYEWVEDTDYEIINMGSFLLPDGANVTAYTFNNTAEDGWNLSAGDWIFMNYTMNVTQAGLYVLPVIIAAFDPVTGLDLSTMFIGAVTVLIPEPLLPVKVEVDEIQLAKVIVGKPAFWSQTIEVFNPNSKPAKARFSIPTFEDTTDAYASYYNDLGEKIEEDVFITGSGSNKIIAWETTLQAMETRQYEVTVLTPPVIEIDRDVEVLEKIGDKSVKLKMDIYLKSLAKEDYQNVRLNLPIAYEKVLRVTDAFGNKLAFTGTASTTTVIIPEVKADEMVSVSIIYKESYPLIIVTSDRDRYELESPVSLEILVINGGERLDYPYIETEVYTPYMNIIHSAIQNLDEMEPLEKTEIYEKFVIPVNAPKGTYIATARFREAFTTIASGTGNFIVAGIPPGINILDVIFILLVLALLYFTTKRIKYMRSGEMPGRREGI